MTVEQLIQILSDYRDQHGPDAEVRLMTQENWPFENSIAGVTSGGDINDTYDGTGDNSDGQDAASDATIYIVEGEQLCYGSKRAWDTCRAC